MQNNKLVLLIILYLFSITSVFGGSAGKNYTYETQEITLYPTAGIVSTSQLFDLKFIGHDIIILAFETKLLERMSIGVSIAFEEFLGNNNNFNFKDYPCFKLKYRLLEEGKYYPAILIGFDGENYLDIPADRNSKYHHSIGPFIVVSKAFSWQLGLIGVHLGANVPIEYNTNNRGNFFLGIEHTLTNFTSFALEYDFNGAYNKEGLLKKGNINLGLKYSIDNNVTLQFSVVDILSNNYSSYKVLNLQFISRLF